MFDLKLDVVVQRPAAREVLPSELRRRLNHLKEMTVDMTERDGMDNETSSAPDSVALQFSIKYTWSR